MTRTQHLVTILGEECNEVAQRCSKALRFGLSEVQPGKEFDNAHRIMFEFADIIAAYEMLQSEGLVPEVDRGLVESKKARVEHHFAYCAEIGEVTA